MRKIIFQTVRCVISKALKPEFIISVILAAVTAILIMKGCSHGAALAMALVTGVEGGKHVVDGPLTTDAVRESGSGLLLNEIDQQIVKIRPMATPLDQISRCAGSKHSGSMIVDYYNVDTKETKTTLKNDYKEPASSAATDEAQTAILNTANNNMFDISDTILVPNIQGFEEDGTTPSKNFLVLYVIAKTDDGRISVSAVNGKKIGNIPNCVPSLTTNSTVIRMGRAATELDVQTPQFEALPQKAQNYCQIFKMQIEQSTLQKIANKEVDWTMSDQEEAAIYDMRLGMEKSFLFGTKRKIYDYKKKEKVLLTGGIWFQAGKNYTFNNTVTEELVIDMMKEAFTGNAGSKRKILIGGSDLISALNKLTFSRVVNANDTVTKWGIDFNEITSKFGKLYVLLSEVFDECGMSKSGIIIDPEYIQKYCHQPFASEALDLKSAGIRNTESVVFSESSCLILRYPKAHMTVNIQSR